MKHVAKSFFLTCLCMFAAAFVWAKGAQDTSLKNIQNVLENTESGGSNQYQSADKSPAVPTLPQQTVPTQTLPQVQPSAQTPGIGILNGLGGSPFTNDEAVSALKDALIEGAIESSGFLSKADAYYKNPLYFIDLPADAEPLVNFATQKYVDDVVLRLNRTAESVASDIVPIFKEAIMSMSVQDGVAIVSGSDDAATKFLKEKTYTQLVSLYKPKITAALDQKLVGKMSANEAWEKLVNAYNKTGNFANKISTKISKKDVMQSIDTDLAQYASEKALDAVFLRIAEEEKQIRKHPLGYASNMIQKVFGAVQKK